MRFSGRAWILGDNIDTDVMAPGTYVHLSAKEIAKHTLIAVRADLAPNFRPGDLILAGKNFGCGSSREQAPHALKALGVSVIVARSFARIFYRNALAIGLPVAISCGPTEAIADLDEVLVDLEAAVLKHVASGGAYPLRSTPKEVIELLEKGGVVPLIEQIARDQKRASGA